MHQSSMFEISISILDCSAEKIFVSSANKDVVKYRNHVNSGLEEPYRSLTSGVVCKKIVL